MGGMSGLRSGSNGTVSKENREWEFSLPVFCCFPGFYARRRRIFAQKMRFGMKKGRGGSSGNFALCINATKYLGKICPKLVEFFVDKRGGLCFNMLNKRKDAE